TTPASSLSQNRAMRRLRMAQTSEFDFIMLKISACRSGPIPFIQAVIFQPLGVGTPDHMLKLPMPGMVNRVLQFVLTFRTTDSNSAVCSAGRCSHAEPLNAVGAGGNWLWAEKTMLTPAKITRIVPPITTSNCKSFPESCDGLFEAAPS